MYLNFFLNNEVDKKKNNRERIIIEQWVFDNIEQNKIIKILYFVFMNWNIETF